MLTLLFTIGIAAVMILAVLGAWVSMHVLSMRRLGDRIHACDGGIGAGADGAGCCQGGEKCTPEQRRSCGVHSPPAVPHAS